MVPGNVAAQRMYERHGSHRTGSSVCLPERRDRPLRVRAAAGAYPSSADRSGASRRRSNTFQPDSRVQRATGWLSSWSGVTLNEQVRNRTAALRLRDRRRRLHPANTRRDRARHPSTRDTRPGCVGARRTRAQRHGAVLRRTPRRVRRHRTRLGAVLWLPLRTPPILHGDVHRARADHRGPGGVRPTNAQPPGRRNLTTRLVPQPPGATAPD